jgi:hypothetical protein
MFSRAFCLVSKQNISVSEKKDLQKRENSALLI